MFCPQCGASNADTAVTCVQCGRSFQVEPPPPVPMQQMPQPGAYPAIPMPPVQNYLVFAILATVLCCLPGGIVAIVYAAQVNGKLQTGDIAGALAASKNAKLWCWISFGVGLGLGLLSLLLGIIGALGNMHR